MPILEREGPELFRVRFGELARKVVKGLSRDAVVQIDPYLLARAVAEVMHACTFRTARGGRLLWNEYRVILARADFDLVRALQGPLERDLGAALADEAAATGAELVGDLRVSVVYDESDELRGGDGMIRVAFQPTEQLASPRSGELTVRFDAAQLSGLMRAVGSTETVIVQDTGAGLGSVRLRWSGGDAHLAAGTTFALGRPHAGAPSPFIALDGANARVNKQQLWLAAAGASVRVGRYPAANPVHVNGKALAPGEEIVVGVPAEIVLSKGELTLSVIAG
ncbi:MAG TPA: FhaA domain-containing protein [Kofleriaceae bacterium]|nr:FhaA domain-containing protein [Kofleriaceae bacterium]